MFRKSKKNWLRVYRQMRHLKFLKHRWQESLLFFPDDSFAQRKLQSYTDKVRLLKPRYYASRAEFKNWQVCVGLAILFDERREAVRLVPSAEGPSGGSIPPLSIPIMASQK